MTPELHERVKVIFLEARELAAQRRGAFVSTRCGDDRELREEVLALLAAECGDVTGWLRAPGLEDLGPRPGRPESIGPYRILETLGEGGMGIVYLAEQHEPVRRRVALKVIKLGMDTRQVLARFDQERQALARMDHPHIARVLDAGATSQGQPYFVMELVTGTPITRFCEERRLSLSGRLVLFGQVCHAVQHAHVKGVIHRDLKPTNILVAEHDGAPCCKIIDFGLARATGEKLTERTLFTERGQLLGTPEYMSPEQADLGGVDIDARTDVYSLGVVLYELLAGCLPFGSDELRRAGLAGIQRTIKEEVPVRPSARVTTLGADGSATADRRGLDPSRLARQLRGDLDWITMKSLEKDRERRYQTPNELAADLERHLQHEPVLAGPPSVGYRLRKVLRRHRGQAAAIGAVLGLLIAGTITSLALYADAREQERLAKREKVEKDGALGLAQKHLDEYLMLADVVSLEKAKQAEQGLWPPYPEVAPRMRTWLRDEAEPLAARLAVLRQVRDGLRARALPEAETRPESRAWRFAMRNDEFLHATLSRLVADLEVFVAASGILESVRSRLRTAETLEDRSIGEHRGEWEAAIDTIAREPRYGGLRIRPQIGLIPLGPDPESRLWEFAHVTSGDVVRRDPSTNLLVTAQRSGIVFVLVPAGEFWMGAQNADPSARNYDPNAKADEAPVHHVVLGAFFLSKYEMTQAQWKLLSGGQQPSYHHPGQKLAGRPYTLRHPVENVDWRMCQTLLTRHGLCLPTEAQWEFACRAGTTGPWSSGPARESLRTPRLIANIADHSVKRVGLEWAACADWPDFDDDFPGHAPVGSFAPNPFGLHDVHGNVGEWTRDLRVRYDAAVRPRDGLRVVQDTSGRVFRGGAFNGSAANARSSCRYMYAETLCSIDIGVRPARELLE